MSLPTDEEIKKWRDRWSKFPGLSDQVYLILKGNKAVSLRDGISRIEKIYNLLLSEDYLQSFEDFGKVQFQHLEIPVLDLRGIQLSFLDLSYIKIPLAHLEGSIATDTNFSKSELRKVHFDGAYLDNSHFEKANLHGSSFKKSDLIGTHFELSYLTNAHFEEAILNSSHFENTTLKRVNFSNAEFYEAHLQGTDFQFANIEGAKFSFCNFSNKTRFIQASPSEQSLVLHEQFSPTTFRQVKYLPSLNDCFKVKFNWKKPWRFLSLGFWKRFNKEKFKKILFKRWFYTDFRDVNIEEADFSGAGDLKRYILDQQFLDRFKANHPFGYKIWNITTNCGWSVWRVAFWSILAILIFAGIYGIPYPIPQWMPDSIATFISNIFGIDPNFSLMDNAQILSKTPELPRFWQLFYISFDIFTNLGIRTTFPMNWQGVVVMFAETVTGFVALGMMISVLTNRFARRS